jgi:hypothetical protein
MRIRRRTAGFIVGAISSREYFYSGIVFQFVYEPQQILKPHFLFKGRWLIPEQCIRDHWMRLNEWYRLKYFSDARETKILVNDELVFKSRNKNLLEAFKREIPRVFQNPSVREDLEREISTLFEEYYSKNGICGAIGFRNDLFELADFRRIRVKTEINGIKKECFSFL